MSVKCDACGEHVDSESINTRFPDRGLVFPFRELGYYGGYTDNEPWEAINGAEMLKICHDCVVKMLDAVPGLASRIAELYGTGLHPTSNADGTPCCGFSWSLKDDV